MSSPALAANIVVNGGFETGDLTGWTCTGADSCGVTSTSHSGAYAMDGYDNTGYGTLSQTLSTTGGTAYDFDFYSYASIDNPGNVLRIDIGGTIFSVPRTTSYALTHGTFIATGPTTAFSFLFETNAGTGIWRIDDVSVTAAVPEPATWSLMIAGFAGLGFAVRRRGRKASART